MMLVEKKGLFGDFVPKASAEKAAVKKADSIPPYVFEDLGDGYTKKVKAFVTHDESIKLSEPLPRSKQAPALNGSDPSAQSAEAPAEEAAPVPAPALKGDKKAAAPKEEAKGEKAPAAKDEAKEKPEDATKAKADEAASFV